MKKLIVYFFIELIPGANKYYPKMEKSAKAASLKGWYREITSKWMGLCGLYLLRDLKQ